MSDIESNDDSLTPASQPSRPISRHLSTSHLETFRVTRSASSVTPMNNYIRPHQTQVPMTSFSTFGQTKSRGDIQDDTSPYSVSRIDEFRIQLRDPYRMRTKSTTQLNSSSASERSSSAHYYQELEDYDADEVDGPGTVHGNDDADSTNLPASYTARSSSGGYESIDAEGLSGGSSEDLPPPPSETSEEYHLHSLSITTSSDSEGMSPIPRDFHDAEALAPPPSKIHAEDLYRIELAFKGRKTQIFVSDSLANLYYQYKKAAPGGRSSGSSGSTTPSMSSGSCTVQSDNEDWVFKYTGVPVLLLDTGETKSRDKRKIQILLAELGSGLALWKDTIDHLSNYSNGIDAEVSSFHTMHLSFDHTKVVGLSFDNPESAHKFWKEVEKLTSDFANISLSGSKQKTKKEGKVKDKKKRDKYVRPSKNDISQPCAFHHVVTVSSKDAGLFSSLQHFVTGKSAIPPVTPPPPLLPNSTSSVGSS